MMECPSSNLRAALRGDRRSRTGLCKNLGRPYILAVTTSGTTSAGIVGGSVSFGGGVEDPSSDILGLSIMGACTSTGAFLADDLKLERSTTSSG